MCCQASFSCSSPDEADQSNNDHCRTAALSVSCHLLAGISDPLGDMPAGPTCLPGSTLAPLTPNFVGGSLALPGWIPGWDMLAAHESLRYS